MNTNQYDHRSVELKWRNIWQKVGLDISDIVRANKPYYNLMMFPYPSAEGLHVGNMYAFTGSDIYGRFKRMQGYDVFEPIGLDGFGIHSENYALKIGRHPMDHAVLTQNNFYTQLRMIGAMFDWDRTVATYDTEYYRWTQWLFVQMFKHGLAYRRKANVNWCPSCKTVLADEQIIDGICERCGYNVSNRSLEQWFFRITAYAGKLLEHLDILDWSEKIKVAQRNWIGEKEGINIRYMVVDENGASLDKEIVCFTTTPVNFAATFLAIAPEHPFVIWLLQSGNREHTVLKSTQIVEIGQYVDCTTKQTSQERLVEDKKKTGVFTGLYAINHVTDKRIPIWISDYVLMGVGTGAIQGCPGHDTRDFEFAMQFDIDIVRVVIGSDGDTTPISKREQVIEHGPGIMINSGFLNGVPFDEAIEKTTVYFEQKGWGKRVKTYHLRDWLISRQRYWGPPIPMIYCEKCAKEGKSWFTSEEGLRMLFPRKRESRIKKYEIPDQVGDDNKPMQGWYPVPEDQLPVVLPRIEDYKPGDDGVAPLAKHKEFYHVACPECGANARRETDVSDTFLDSSWYFLRYPSVGAEVGETFSAHPSSLSPSAVSSKSMYGMTVLEKAHLPAHAYGSSDSQPSNHSLPWNPAITKKWLPVDMYTGGAEHSVLHLLYSRFITMALHDMRFLDFEEPFTRFYAHGLVIKDGAKMSKSKGNVVNPDTYIQQYGVDALRLYLMFMGPFSQGGDFRDSAMEGMSRWVGRVWRMAMKSVYSSQFTVHNEINRALHALIKKVTVDTQKRRYNTAIAAMMSFTNLVSDHGGVLALEDLQKFILLLAPYAPYLAEEVFQRIRSSTVSESMSDERPFVSVHVQPWPNFDATKLTEDTVNVIIQVNGKHRDTVVVSRQSSVVRTEVEQVGRSSQKVAKHLEGKIIKKVIFVPNKLINFVL